MRKFFTFFLTTFIIFFCFNSFHSLKSAPENDSRPMPVFRRQSVLEDGYIFGKVCESKTDSSKDIAAVYNTYDSSGISQKHLGIAAYNASTHTYNILGNKVLTDFFGSDYENPKVQKNATRTVFSSMAIWRTGNFMEIFLGCEYWRSTPPVIADDMWHNWSVFEVDFSFDTKLFSAAKPLSTPYTPMGRVSGLYFSPNGMNLYMTGTTYIVILGQNAGTKDVLYRFRGSGTYGNIKWSPDPDDLSTWAKPAGDFFSVDKITKIYNSKADPDILFILTSVGLYYLNLSTRVVSRMYAYPESTHNYYDDITELAEDSKGRLFCGFKTTLATNNIACFYWAKGDYKSFGTPIFFNSKKSLGTEVDNISFDKNDNVLLTSNTGVESKEYNGGSYSISSNMFYISNDLKNVEDFSSRTTNLEIQNSFFNPDGKITYITFSDIFFENDSIINHLQGIKPVISDNYEKNTYDLNGFKIPKKNGSLSFFAGLDDYKNNHFQYRSNKYIPISNYQSDYLEITVNLFNKDNGLVKSVAEVIFYKSEDHQVFNPVFAPSDSQNFHYRNFVQLGQKLNLTSEGNSYAFLKNQLQIKGLTPSAKLDQEHYVVSINDCSVNYSFLKDIGAPFYNKSDFNNVNVARNPITTFNLTENEKSKKTGIGVFFIFIFVVLWPTVVISYFYIPKKYKNKMKKWI